MQLENYVFEIVDKILNCIAGMIGLLLLLYACYTWLDTQQIYENASATSYSVYNPKNQESFEELVKINPEVIGWLTVEDTNINYPLTQGTDNSKYVNTDAKGNASLSGSLFLDCRNHPDFSDFNNIIYGHHMAKEKMFGELEYFSGKKYFQNHRWGKLYYGGEYQKIEFFAFLETDAYDYTIYNPEVKEEDEKTALLEYIDQYAKQKRKCEVTAYEHLLVLSTCTSGETNGRDILIGKIVDVDN